MKIYGVLDKSHTREMSWSKKRDLQKQIDVTLDAVEASVSRSHSTKEKSNNTHVQPKHITSSNLETFINDGIVSFIKYLNLNISYSRVTSRAPSSSQSLKIPLTKI